MRMDPEALLDLIVVLALGNGLALYLCVTGSGADAIPQYLLKALIMVILLIDAVIPLLVFHQASTARSPSAQSKETRRQEPRGAAELVDVVFVDKLSREPITYTPVSFSGSSFSVPELGLSSCVFLDAAPFSAYTVAF